MATRRANARQWVEKEVSYVCAANTDRARACKHVDDTWKCCSDSAPASAGNVVVRFIHAPRQNISCNPVVREEVVWRWIRHGRTLYRGLKSSAIKSRLFAMQSNFPFSFRPPHEHALRIPLRKKRVIYKFSLRRVCISIFFQHVPQPVCLFLSVTKVARMLNFIGHAQFFFRDR